MTHTSAIQPKGISLEVVARRIGQQAKGLVFMALWIALLFLCAGRADWIRGWACVGIYLVCVAATGMIVHHANHDLLERRAKWQHKVPRATTRYF